MTNIRYLLSYKVTEDKSFSMIIPEDSSDLLTVSFVNYEESYSGCNESGYESFCGQESSGELSFFHLNMACSTNKF